VNANVKIAATRTANFPTLFNIANLLVQLMLLAARILYPSLYRHTSKKRKLFGL